MAAPLAALLVLLLAMVTLSEQRNVLRQPWALQARSGAGNATAGQPGWAAVTDLRLHRHRAGRLTEAQLEEALEKLPVVLHPPCPPSLLPPDFKTPSPPPPPPPRPPRPEPPEPRPRPQLRALLKDLRISGAELQPHFETTRFAYEVEVATESVTVTPILGSDKASRSFEIYVDGTEVLNATASRPISFARNDHIRHIFVTVGAPVPYWSSNYVVKIIRISPRYRWTRSDTTGAIVGGVVLLALLAFLAFLFVLAKRQEAWPFGSNPISYPWESYPEYEEVHPESAYTA